MRKTIWAIVIMAVCTIWTACEKHDYEVVAPSFKGFLYSPTTLHPGDSVTFKACYDDPGKNIYFAQGSGITWTLTVDTLDAGGDDTKNGKWTWKKKPSCTIAEAIYNHEHSIKTLIPKTAKPGSNATLTFEAKYDNACDGVPGTTRPNTTAEGYHGKFDNSVIKSAYFTLATGSMTFRIE